MANRAGDRKAEPGESQRGLVFRRQMKELAGVLHKKQLAAKQLKREEPAGGPADGARGNDAPSQHASLPSLNSALGSDGTATGTGHK